VFFSSRRRHTRSYGDWSSDVCSSDLAVSRVAWGQLDPYTCWRTNQLGTLNVLEACRKAKTSPVLFYASSREVYGEPKYFPVDERSEERRVGKECRSRRWRER